MRFEGQLGVCPVADNRSFEAAGFGQIVVIVDGWGVDPRAWWFAGFGARAGGPGRRRNRLARSNGGRRRPGDLYRGVFVLGEGGDGVEDPAAGADVGVLGGA